MERAREFADVLVLVLRILGGNPPFAFDPDRISRRETHPCPSSSRAESDLRPPDSEMGLWPLDCAGAEEFDDFAPLPHRTSHGSEAPAPQFGGVRRLLFSRGFEHVGFSLGSRETVGFAYFDPLEAHYV